MSIQQTHLILMAKGPDAEEFWLDSKDKQDFGNTFTWAEYHLINVYFFL